MHRFSALWVVALPVARGYTPRGLSRSAATGPASKISSAQPRSTAKNSALPRSNDKKSRKVKRRAACDGAQMRKLGLDADFFWECVDARNRGKDIRGASGRPYARPTARSLFGDRDVSPTTDALLQRQEDAGVVDRSGGGRTVAPVAAFDALRALLPGYAYQNLVGADRMRYTSPSPIQRHCVPLGLAGVDCLACAQTGSGKTVAFLLPLIASVAARREVEDAAAVLVRASSNKKKATPAVPAALILAPTRELALQIELEIEKLTFGAPPHGSARWCAAVYGGTKPRPQLEALASGVEIVVATPGRLADFLSRGLVSLANCNFLVLDEADRMLDMGFGPQLRSIVEQSDMPRKEERQTLLFSATFPQPLQEIARRSYLRDGYAHVAVGKIGASNAAVTQRLVQCAGTGTKRDKLETLLPLLDNKKERTIIFVNKKHHATWLARELERRHVRSVQIHGDRTQPQREKALRSFRDGAVDILVATDAVSRGIDVADVSHVVQFDLPVSTKEFESYTHRIGRTGRAGKTGVATAIYVPGNEPKLGNGELWQLLKKTFDETHTTLPGWFKHERSCPPIRPAQKKVAAPAATKSRRQKKRLYKY